MFVMCMRDGSRVEIAAEEEAEALRELIRRNGAALELGGDQVDPPAALLALGLARPGLLDAFGQDWQPPTGAEVRELLKVAQLSSSTAGRLVGVPGGKVRKWAGDDGSMPYAVWRLLLIYARLAEPARLALDEIKN